MRNSILLLRCDSTKFCLFRGRISFQNHNCAAENRMVLCSGKRLENDWHLPPELQACKRLLNFLRPPRQQQMQMRQIRHSQWMRSLQSSQKMHLPIQTTQTKRPAAHLKSLQRKIRKKRLPYLRLLKKHSRSPRQCPSRKKPQKSVLLLLLRRLVHRPNPANPEANGSLYGP